MSKPLIVQGVEYPKKFLIEIGDNGDVYLDGEQIAPITLAYIAQGIVMLSEEGRPKKQIEVREKRKPIVIDFDETFLITPKRFGEGRGIYAIGEDVVYVGRSGSIKDRLKSHVLAALNGTHHNPNLQQYIVSTLNSGEKIKVELFTGLKPTDHYEGMVMHTMVTQRKVRLMNIDLKNMLVYQTPLTRFNP